MTLQKMVLESKILKFEESVGFQVWGYSSRIAIASDIYPEEFVPLRLATCELLGEAIVHTNIIKTYLIFNIIEGFSSCLSQLSLFIRLVTTCIKWLMPTLLNYY